MNYPGLISHSSRKAPFTTKKYSDFELLEESPDYSSNRQKFNEASNNFEESFNSLRDHSKSKDKKTMNDFNKIMDDFSTFNRPLEFCQGTHYGSRSPIVLQRQHSLGTQNGRLLSFLKTPDNVINIGSVPKAHSQLLIKNDILSSKQSLGHNSRSYYDSETPINLHSLGFRRSQSSRPFSFAESSNFVIDVDNLPTSNLRAHPKLIIEVIEPRESFRKIPETESELKKRIIEEKLDKLLGYRAPRYSLSKETKEHISTLNGSKMKHIFNSNLTNDDRYDDLTDKPRMKFINHQKHIHMEA